MINHLLSFIISISTVTPEEMPPPPIKQSATINNQQERAAHVNRSHASLALAFFDTRRKNARVEFLTRSRGGRAAVAHARAGKIFRSLPAVFPFRLTINLYDRLTSHRGCGHVKPRLRGYFSQREGEVERGGTQCITLGVEKAR